MYMYQYLAFWLLVVELYNIYHKNATGVYFLGKWRWCWKLLILMSHFCINSSLLLFSVFYFLQIKFWSIWCFFSFRDQDPPVWPKFSRPWRPIFDSPWWICWPRWWQALPTLSGQSLNEGPLCPQNIWQKGKVMYCLFFQNKKKHHHCNFFKYCL